jgi:hypothetical protein
MLIFLCQSGYEDSSNMTIQYNSKEIIDSIVQTPSKVVIGDKLKPAMITERCVSHFCNSNPMIRSYD